ncbi:response regulator [Gimesia aquarii]|uniref:Response regulator rcp1 n=1 Tax=Gimesia aquarii TaxID=2527964 RepID=A0A517X026_9PLAN|nr:response regulator [Gimesia aquarii]QDU10859.1 Response regulator rcp1 [Gimesia aquarii]
MTPFTNNPLTRPVEILIVEDDLTDIKLTQRSLERNRVLNNLHITRDGIEAMQFLRQEGDFSDVPRPDIVLLDLNMPRKDGRETLRDIKNDPNLKAIPVIIMTTSKQETDIEGSYLEHANSYVTKPVDMEQFQKVVETINAYWFTVVKLPSD